MLNADLKEFEFISDFDKLVISAVLAVPSGDVHGIVQFVHGMNEHKERYYPFMDYLAEQGYFELRLGYLLPESLYEIRSPSHLDSPATSLKSVLRSAGFQGPTSHPNMTEDEHRSREPRSLVPKALMELLLQKGL